MLSTVLVTGEIVQVERASPNSALFLLMLLLAKGISDLCVTITDMVRSIGILSENYTKTVHA